MHADKASVVLVVLEAQVAAVPVAVAQADAEVAEGRSKSEK